MHAYRGRDIAMASLHGKQQILARPLRSGLGLRLLHAAAVDTDQFGSFSGERPRRLEARLTCQRMAEAALEALALELGVASEGSFGPHPAVPLLPVGHEWLCFVDRRDGLVISEQLLSRSTNYSSCRGDNPEAIAGWLAKGVHSPPQLAALMAEAARRSPLRQAWLETDRRAHCNPTRRRAIRQLAFRLVRRVASPCPACRAPGWGPVDTTAGLPCRDCAWPPRW